MQKVRLGWAAVTFLGLAASLVSSADDWVLHVPAGKQSADAVAELHELHNLGEVIPETNLYHFKQKAKRRKRSLQELQDAFEINPAVNAHYVQDKSLSRTKRIPLPDQDVEEDHQLVRRQSAPVRSTGNQICFVNTVQTDTKDSKRCIFPFSYKGKTYVQCTADHSGNGAEWCATQVDANGEVINKQWGDCDTKSLSCLTLEAGSLGTSNVNQQRPAAPPQRPSAPRRPAPPPRRPSSGNFALPPGFQGQVRPNLNVERSLE